VADFFPVNLIRLTLFASTVCLALIYAKCVWALQWTKMTNVQVDQVVRYQIGQGSCVDCELCHFPTYDYMYRIGCEEWIGWMRKELVGTAGQVATCDKCPKRWACMSCYYNAWMHPPCAQPKHEGIRCGRCTNERPKGERGHFAYTTPDHVCYGWWCYRCTDIILNNNELLHQLRAIKLEYQEAQYQTPCICSQDMEGGDTPQPPEVEDDTQDDDDICVGIWE
jgi:hypothetical protein